jgi:hypothetical protein
MSVSVGTGVAVGTGVLVRVGIAVGGLVEVGPGPGRRVRVGEKNGLKNVTVAGGVSEGSSVAVGDSVTVFVSVKVGVVRNSGTAATVSAATVFKFETARSSRLPDWLSTGAGCWGSASAIAETTQNRLKPRAPAASTPKGPEYSLTLTISPLLPDRCSAAIEKLSHNSSFPEDYMSHRGVTVL